MYSCGVRDFDYSPCGVVLQFADATAMGVQAHKKFASPTGTTF